MNRARGWYVEIVRADGGGVWGLYNVITEGLKKGGAGRVEHAVGPYPSERGAERGERGVSINLDHARYSTRVVEEKAGK